jgi:hypothetical protein
MEAALAAAPTSPAAPPHQGLRRATPMAPIGRGRPASAGASFLPQQNGPFGILGQPRTEGLTRRPISVGRRERPPGHPGGCPGWPNGLRGASRLGVSAFAQRAMTAVAEGPAPLSACQESVKQWRILSAVAAPAIKPELPSCFQLRPVTPQGMTLIFTVRTPLNVGSESPGPTPSVSTIFHGEVTAIFSGVIDGRQRAFGSSLLLLSTRSL